jgi:hypothetical protein
VIELCLTDCFSFLKRNRLYYDQGLSHFMAYRWAGSSFEFALVGQRENVCIAQVIPFIKRLKHELATIVSPGIRTFQRAVEEKMNIES